jgi:hypothetical protein
MTGAEKSELLTDLRKLTPGERLALRTSAKAQSKKEKRERRRAVASS